MGDVSIIARRLTDGHVQFGWSGNGGYFWTVGAFLLADYNSPEMVEYLFGLGQLSRIWHPQSELSSDEFRTEPTGQPHYLTDNEDKIFRQIHFVDYAYFYDQNWYYIHPDVFLPKIRLEAVWRYMEQKGGQFENGFNRIVLGRIIKEIFGNWYWNDQEFQKLAQGCGFDNAAASKMVADLNKCLNPEEDDEDEDAFPDLIYGFAREHGRIVSYFDSWVVVETDEDMEISKILMRKREEKHLETNQWGVSKSWRATSRNPFSEKK